MSTFYGSAPFNHTAKWHPEPTFRGTFSILSSCLITMALCVWTAVHLNIPAHREKAAIGFITPQFIRKIKWLFIGLLAPEFVAWAALEQRKIADRIYKSVRQSLKQIDRPSPMKRFFPGLMHLLWRERDQMHKPKELRHEWTMTHAFYTAMGGFAIDTSDEQIHFLADKKYTRFMLTPEGVMWLANWRPELIPNIPKSEIQDKSKASGLAKMLVCVQATWFCVQCVVRLGQKLNISLLELNTFVHALCTLITYALWWSKPLDIFEPTLLTGQHMKETAALLLVLSARSKGFAYATQTGKHLYHTYNLPLEAFDAESTALKRPLPDSGSLDGFQTHRKSRTIGFNSVEHSSQITLASTEWLCLKIATENVRPAPTELPDRAPLQHRAYNLMEIFDDLSTLYVSILTGLFYGGLHLTAWNAPFPTHTQMLLWRLSGLTLVASGFIYIGISVTFVYFEEKDSFTAEIINFLSTLLFGLFLLFYVFCRFYIVVESFITVAYLPDSVFHVPAWSRYFPHIG